MSEMCGTAVKQIVRLHERLEQIQEAAGAIDSVLNGNEGDLLDPGGRPPPTSFEERLESLHVGLEEVYRQLRAIRERLQQMSRTI